MDNSTRHCLTSYLNELSDRCKAERSTLDQLSEYLTKKLKLRCEKDCSYYYILMPDENRYRYLGSGSNEMVMKIKEAHHLQLSVKELEREIHLIEKLLRSSHDISYDAIDQRLTSAYRGSPAFHSPRVDSVAKQWKDSSEMFKSSFAPFRPDELIHTTRDGTMVRSKGEALIYNYLSEQGISFVYELPLRIRLGSKNSLLLPDFTILSEIDYTSVIFIEHQGMMDDPKYRNGFNEKVFRYWSNNYLPERDVFFTFDLPNGGTDNTAVKSIIRRYIRPEIISC